MPLQLNTPVNTNGLDPNASEYTQVKITDFRHSSVRRFMVLICEYGNTDGYGEWQSGVVNKIRYRVTGVHYDNLVNETSDGSGEVYYDKVSQSLYQWLVDNAYYSGSYV